jgi:hypothetical protein
VFLDAFMKSPYSLAGRESLFVVHCLSLTFPYTLDSDGIEYLQSLKYVVPSFASRNFPLY